MPIFASLYVIIVIANLQIWDAENETWMNTIRMKEKESKTLTYTKKKLDS